MTIKKASYTLGIVLGCTCILASVGIVLGDGESKATLAKQAAKAAPQKLEIKQEGDQQRRPAEGKTLPSQQKGSLGANDEEARPDRKFKRQPPMNPDVKSDGIPTGFGRRGAPDGSDDCASATPISGTGNFPFDNTAATTDGPPHATCLFFGQDQFDHDVWFCWTAACTDSVTVQTCSLTTVDTKIAVYDGCGCPVSDANLLACNDDFCGLQSQVTFSATMNNTYLIRIGTFPSSAGGTGQFNISCGTPIGACCLSDGMCFETDSLANCTAGGGTWQGLGTACGTAGCDAPRACCFSNGDCMDLSPADCATALGSLQALGTSCGSFTCPVVPNNDECAGAIAMNCGDTITADNTSATQNLGDPTFPCRAIAAGPGFGTIWYSFVATHTSARVFTGGVAPADDSLLAVYDGCGGTQLACDDDSGPGLLSDLCVTGLTIGNTYIIELAGWGATDLGAYSLTLQCPCPPGACCFPNGDCQDLSAEDCATAIGTFQGIGTDCGSTTCPIAPGNDECANAIAMNCGDTVTADNTTATQNAGDPTFPCRAGTPGPGFGTIWYSFVATHTTARVSTGGVAPADNSILAVYDGCGGTQLGCDDDSGAGLLSDLCVSGLTVGNTYIIEVAGYSAADLGAYSLTLQCPCPPGACCFPNGDCQDLSAEDCATANGNFHGMGTDCGSTTCPIAPINDECGGAIAVACDSSASADNTTATENAGDPAFSCHVGGSAQGFGTVWFTFVATDDSAHLFTGGTGTATDSLLAVYDGTCGALSELACSDDEGAGLFSDLCVGSLVVGNTYYVQVAAYSIASLGPYTLNIECPCPPPPANETCDGATVITTLPFSDSFNNDTATADGPPGSCNTSGATVMQNDLWYVWVPTQDCVATLNVNPTVYDGITAVWTGPDCLSLSEVACGDEPEPHVIMFSATAGTTYWIQIGDWGTSEGGGATTIALDCIGGTGACCNLSTGDCQVLSAQDCFTAGGSFQGDGTDCDPNPCPQPSGGETCEVAFPVTGPYPTTVIGNNTAALDEITPTCVVGTPNQQLWYTLTGTGNSITLSTCNPGTDFDTMLQVFCGSCANLVCVGGNDDDFACGLSGLRSTVTFCSQAGATYYIAVSGFSATSGNFEMTVSDNGTACTPSVQCLPIGRCCISGNCSINTQIGCTGLGGTYEGDGTNCDAPGAPTYTASPGTAIPDNNPAGITSVINVPDSFTIGDLNLALNIPHTWVGDLCVSIEHNATTVLVIARMGSISPNADCYAGSPFGCAQDNLVNIVLDDEGAGGPIEALCVLNATSPPNYVPNNPLSVFDGADATGDWTLTVVDNAGGDLGTLVSWTLTFNSDATNPCPPAGLKADMNCDTIVNGKDVDGFALALISPAAYAIKYPGCPISNGDINNNGLNTADLPLFVNCVLLGGCP